MSYVGLREEKPLGTHDVVLETVAEIRNSLVKDQDVYFLANGRYKQVWKHTRGGKIVSITDYEAPLSFGCQKTIRDGSTTTPSCFGYHITIIDGATTTSIGYGIDAATRTWVRVRPIVDNTATSS